jgi:hypothetical protein
MKCFVVNDDIAASTGTGRAAADPRSRVLADQLGFITADHVACNGAVRRAIRDCELQCQGPASRPRYAGLRRGDIQRELELSPGGPIRWMGGGAAEPPFGIADRYVVIDVCVVMED